MVKIELCGTQGGEVNIEELERVIRLLKEEDLTEITIWDGKKRMTVCRESVSEKENRGGDVSSHVEEEKKNQFIFTSPLVGTFYRRSSPEEEPFVDEGSLVKPGDTLCIIEAMKALNEINATESGRLLRILIEDGQTAEYGDPLFLFERT
jgi:acetyl-CoA carboxylase biotin carboxyl carrier protein